MSTVKRFAVDTRIALANFLMTVPSHRVRVYVARTLMRWSIGDDVVVGRYLRVFDLGGVTVGDVVNIGHHAYIDGRGGLRIGSNVDMAAYVTIHTADHFPDSPTFEGRRRLTTIGDRVWLGTGATVMCGATVADGVIVGAKCVAAGKLEPNGIYVGSPARLVRHRAPDAQTSLQPYRRFWM